MKKEKFLKPLKFEVEMKILDIFFDRYVLELQPPLFEDQERLPKFYEDSKIIFYHFFLWLDMEGMSIGSSKGRLALPYELVHDFLGVQRSMKLSRERCRLNADNDRRRINKYYKEAQDSRESLQKAEVKLKELNKKLKKQA